MCCERAVVSHLFGVVLSLVLWQEVCEGKTLPLILRQSPYSGGQMDPEPGIYYFEEGTEVRLTANPGRGYRFIRWLGSVADPNSAVTIAYLDQPKVIIAVFQAAPVTAGAGGLEQATIGSLRSQTPVVSRRLYAAGGGGGGGVPYSHVSPQRHTGHIVIPEPATVLLVGLSAAVLRRRRLRRL